jgi:D-xylose transport system permease protein
MTVTDKNEKVSLRQSVDMKQYGILIALVALVIAFTFVYYAKEGNFTFFSPENFSNIVGQVMVVGILSVAMTFVILVAEIDLGVGSVVAITGVAVCMMIRHGISVWLAVPATLVLGTLIGAWNGFWISRFRIHSFIVTLGMLVIGRGLAQIVSGRQNISPNFDPFTDFFFTYVPKVPSAILIFCGYAFWAIATLRASAKRKQYGFAPPPDSLEIAKLFAGFLLFAFLGWIFCGAHGLPAPFLIWVFVVAAGIFVLDHTIFGRYLYAIGGNSEAAHLSGINVPKIKWMVFAICGLLSAAAGILAASREGGATPGNIGKLNELDAIAAVVIGGTSLMGGVGHVRGTIVGLFMLAVLANGMSILGIPQDWQEVIKGLIIILAAWFDAKTKVRKH